MQDKYFGTFGVDHTRLKCGIYLSRVDSVQNVNVYTLDIRTNRPYVDEPYTDMVGHSVEHIMANELEKCSTTDLHKIYWGEQGCRTGWYFVFSGTRDNCQLSRVAEMFLEAIKSWDGTVPFNSMQECGNCRTLAVTDEQLEDVRKMIDKIGWLFMRVFYSNKWSEYNK